MIYLSKSKYCAFWQCPKMAWLNKYKPEEKTEDPSLEAVFTRGNEVGDLAMGLFGDFVEVTTYSGEKLDLSAMIKKTMSIPAEIYTAAVSISGLIRFASAYVFTTAFSHNNTDKYRCS